MTDTRNLDFESGPLIDRIRTIVREMMERERPSSQSDRIERDQYRTVAERLMAENARLKSQLEASEVAAHQLIAENERLQSQLREIRNQVGLFYQSLNGLDCSLSQVDPDKKIVQTFIERYCVRNPRGRVPMKEFDRALSAFLDRERSTPSVLTADGIIRKHFPELTVIYHEGGYFYDGLEWMNRQSFPYVKIK